MNNYIFKLTVFIITIVFLQNYSFSAVTVLGKGDASLCYQAAKFGYSGKSSVKHCLTAINDIAITKKNLGATYVNLGIIYNNSKKPDDAIKYLNKGTEFQDTIAEAMLSIGNSHYIKKNYDKAIEFYDKSLEKGLNDISAVYFNKGLVYERLNNVNLAVDYYKRAIDLKPQYYEYFEKRARMQRTGEWVN
ncbi:MAG: tetratricopeptide repeat protein [Pseudomonadota bacterium]|nr:tetratricopeptide repeat protein [Pseudomonadota bacterium]